MKDKFTYYSLLFVAFISLWALDMFLDDMGINFAMRFTVTLLPMGAAVFAIFYLIFKAVKQKKLHDNPGIK